jgi:hypothetical protein
VNTTTSKTQPALIGGLVMGVLSALPIISGGNLCCCLWVVSGGVVAAYLLQQDSPSPITNSDGAMVGLLAGLIGAIVCWIVSIPINIIFAPMERRIIGSLLQNAENMPPGWRDMMERSQGGAFHAARLVLALFFWLFAGAIFSTIGGLLGATFFRKPLPPADATPSS